MVLKKNTAILLSSFHGIVTPEDFVRKQISRNGSLFATNDTIPNKKDN